jgi:hypothetical protein
MDPVATSKNAKNATILPTPVRFAVTEQGNTVARAVALRLPPIVAKQGVTTRAFYR